MDPIAIWPDYRFMSGEKGNCEIPSVVKMELIRYLLSHDRFQSCGSVNADPVRKKGSILKES